jgi:hypothetical protein
MLPLWQSVQILVWGGLPSMAKQGQTMVLLSTAENHKQNGRNRNRKSGKTGLPPISSGPRHLNVSDLMPLLSSPHKRYTLYLVVEEIAIFFKRTIIFDIQISCGPPCIDKQIDLALFQGYKFKTSEKE